MVERRVNDFERHVLANYQHLMSKAERTIAQALVAVDFDTKQIPKTVWQRVGSEYPGVDRAQFWKLPILLCLRLLREHRNEIEMPTDK